MAKNVLLLNDPDNSLGEIQEAIQKAGYTAYMTDNSDDAIELFEKIWKIVTPNRPKIDYQNCEVKYEMVD